MKAEVAGAVQSEYATKYATKSDHVDINQTLVRVAAVLEDGRRTNDRKKTSILSKCLNTLNKSLAFPLVMSAFYVRGYGDSWFTLRTKRLDARAFQRDLQGGGVAAYADAGQTYTLVVGERNAMGNVTLAALDDVTLYRYY